jgi:hypothetical protein
MIRKWLAIPTVFLCGLLLISAGENAPLKVTVRDAQIRSKPTYLGSIVARLKYGADVVQSDDPQKGWVKVSLPSGKSAGWINMSAITEFKGELKSGSGNASQAASTGNIQAAGKGFTKEIEIKYQSEEHLDYTWVNSMEKYIVTAEQAASFLTTGGLTNTPGGAE